MQGCGSQFFPTNTKRNLLMAAEHVLPRGKELKDRKGTAHFTSPSPRWLQAQHRVLVEEEIQDTVTWNQLAHNS